MVAPVPVGHLFQLTLKLGISKGLTLVVKVVHFTAEVKPWTFFYRAHGEFASMYDQGLFWLWAEQARRTEQVVGTGVFRTSMAIQVVP